MSCTPGFLLVCAVLIYLDGQGVVLWGALACGVHELGHMAAAAALGGQVKCLRLTAVGAEMVLDATRPLSCAGELLCAMAGPAASLVWALCAARLGLFTAAGVSLGLGLFNLLPARALDGGRALEYASMLWTRRTLQRPLEVLNAGTVGGLLGAGAAACLAWGNPTLLVTALWLTAGTVKAA